MRLTPHTLHQGGGGGDGGLSVAESGEGGALWRGGVGFFCLLIIYLSDES